ncbi:MAG: Peptidyl-prolyl cis-trans isomerase [Labilithrix sp.]|nr:Peptidyl-prolyl cis-trans isomerase [Labilithrix sp.]
MSGSRPLPAVALGALVALLACSKPSADSADAAAVTEGGAAASTNAAGALDSLAVASAEDLRRAKDVPAEARTSHDVASRRRSARALARIADAASVEGLVAHLADEDGEVVAWAAYGLGHACKGREDAHVKMLAARAATLGGDAGTSARPAGRGVLEIEPRTAIARGIGRCGGTLAEQSLVSLLKIGGTWQEPTLLGLGDLARSRKQIGADAMTVLLDAALPRTTAGASPLAADGAFYALSRADAGEAFGKRVLEAASAALVRPGDARILAIKTVGRAGKDLAKEAAPQLLKVVADAKSFTYAERAEAARSLGLLSEPGQSAAADALARLVPDNDALAIQGLIGPDFHVLHTLVGSLGNDAPKKAEPALRALANITAPAEPKPALARRLAELRCAAALALARGVYDAEILRKCDVESSEISQHARLASLLRRPIVGERKAVFRTFAKSEHLRIREMAVEAVGQHHELGDAAAAILAEALLSKKAGLVATAADVVDRHPDLAMVLADSEKRAALDPRAPPPTTDPAQELSRDVAKALTVALAEKWPEDRFETRIALIEAAASVRHPQAKAAAIVACNDANVVVRERAQKALRTLGEAVAACDAPDRLATPAPELGKALRGAVRISFTTDADVGPLTFALEPELSPITVTRIASLVRSGFYDGIVVHRVAPGFVVQFGDPEGDGYGGSGTSLRCETSPVPFAPLDIGMALAGRDTGSSQVFVTLSRTPHLDGEYTRIGRAEGAWASLAQGDRIAGAKVVE